MRKVRPSNSPPDADQGEYERDGRRAGTLGFERGGSGS